MITSDFKFEKLTAEDLPFLIEVRNECREFLHDNRAFTLEQCQEWFRETKPDFWLIRYRGERVGYFRLSNYDPAEKSSYIGADLHKDFRGLGLARKAYEAFIPVVKEKYGVSTLKLEVLSHNEIAHRLYQKLGFIETDRKLAYTTRIGAPVDSIVMQKLIAADSTRRPTR